ncbi:hypothetical protein D1872_294210 [compost metagenome]
MRHALVRHAIDRVGELDQLLGQHLFGLFVQGHVAGQGLGIYVRLAEDGLDAGVGVLQVRGSVAFKRQHHVPVEDVVCGAVLGEIRILDRAHGDGVHHLGLVFGAEIAVAALRQGTGALFGLV